MSFYTNNSNSVCCPGPINGNPLNGLCERVCIRTTKVFDSAMKQLSLQNVQHPVDFENGEPPLPITYIGAQSDPNNPSFITNLIVDRLVDRPNYARVSGIVNIPIIISFTDGNNNTGSATSTTTVPFDVVLFVPQPSIIPYRVEGFGALTSNIGTYSGNSIFTIDECVTIIIRVVVDAELCVPSYGYCQIPPAIEFSQDQCAGVFELPLFPTATQ
ncbi:MAG: hypothetical protein IJZ29_01570 [Clostridia bacterium]|nr:hypothetical protein [Clostridia bacterium]